MRTRRAFRPFAMRSRRTVIAIVVTMALVSALSAFLSIQAASHSRHRATVIEIAGRQRTLAERYVQEVLPRAVARDLRAAMRGKLGAARRAGRPRAHGEAPQGERACPARRRPRALGER